MFEFLGGRFGKTDIAQLASKDRTSVSSAFCPKLDLKPYTHTNDETWVIKINQNLDINTVSKVLLILMKVKETSIKPVRSTFKFGYPCLTLKGRPKVKFNHTRRFPVHDFSWVGLPSQTSRTNNKWVISTFKFGYPRLTLNERPKVKSDHTRRFPAHDFL